MSFSRVRRADGGGRCNGYRYQIPNNQDNRHNYDHGNHSNNIYYNYNTSRTSAISRVHNDRVRSDPGASPPLPFSSSLKRKWSDADDNPRRYRSFRSDYNGGAGSADYNADPFVYDNPDRDLRRRKNRPVDNGGAEGVIMSRDEIERCSPSRKDGIDLTRETHLRYSYCSYIRNLGIRLQLPQTTIATATVLCHRFFLRRSHASHDRFMIATAALFLAAKSEETPCPLNSILLVACEVCQKHDFVFFTNIAYTNWFEQLRERVIEAETLILTTLDFELSVQHPYAPLSSVLNKLGLSQSVLFTMAWNLVNEGVLKMCLHVLYSYLESSSSLWLQFKPHHIAAGATFLAAKFLNFDLAPYRCMWQDFQMSPYILREVIEQLMEVF